MNKYRDSEFKIALVGRAKNGVLWELVERFGSAHKLADHLEIGYTQLMSLINMKWFPGDAVRKTERWQKIEDKFLLLTGKGLDDLFPPELRAIAEGEGLKFAVVKEIPTCALSEAAHLQLPPMQDATILADELKTYIERALESLTPREGQILRMRFGLDGAEHTLAEVAEVFGITATRVQAIEEKALRRMRHPARSRELKQFLE
jgi:RNA polymerase sigma factor (sigma-70 family)